MSTRWDAFRRFLTAEEVPRWFGLSLVLIYLVGLLSVGQFGMAQTRKDAAAQFRDDSRFAVRQLAERLATIDGARPGEPGWTGGCNRVLRDYVLNMPAKSLRIVDSGSAPPGRIVASTSPSEVGGVAPDVPEGATLSNGLAGARLPPELGEDPRWLIRAVIPSRVGANSSTSQSVSPMLDGPPSSITTEKSEPPPSASSLPTGGSLFVEAVLPLEPPVRNQWARRATISAVVLVVLGAFFLAYRCLREQLRGVSRIADRLETHGNRLEQDLGSLRITDGRDTVTEGWNKLVDLTQGLVDAVRQKDANEELSRVLQRSGGGALAEALHAVPDGIIYVADETRFEYLNSAACRLLGWPTQTTDRPALSEAKSEGVGDKLLDLLRGALQPDGRFEARIELIETGDTQGRDQSSYRTWLVPLQRARHGGECVVIVRDVSQQVRAERAREEFIAQVTHEFRTPLTNIRAYTETLSSGMFEDPQTISECYNVITKETRRLSRLIEDILSVSQLEVGSIELHSDNVDLKSLLGEGVRDVRGIAEEKNIDVQLILPAKLEPIRADRDKLAVVINNLLGNAIKYTASGGNVIVGCQISSDSVVLTVKDNGMGIAAQDQARVFEKFQRGSDPEVQGITGTGIGLYTAREIVRRHGGDIELISEKGAGSTFMVRLPHRESRATAKSTAQVGESRG